LPLTIALAALQPLVSGANRDVYQHPHDPGFLIKVIKPAVAERYERRRDWYRTDRRNGYYRTLLREIEEYLALRRRGQHLLPFVPQFAGVVDTDLGYGVMVGKVCGRDGNLAPTITALVERDGMNDALRGRIDELRADVVRHHIVFGDISGRNVVHADDREHGNRLVIIDGLSDRLWIPVNSMSRSINRIYCERRFARMVATLERIDRQRALGEHPVPGAAIR
jgi:hypothetical protein